MQITLDYVHEHAQTNILEQNYSRVFIKNWRPKAIQHPSRLCRHVFKYLISVWGYGGYREREKMEIILRFAKHFILSDIPNYSATSQLLPHTPQNNLLKQLNNF